MKPRERQAMRYAERSVSERQSGIRADRSEGMKGIAGLLIDRTRGRGGVAASDTGGHRC